MTLIEHLGELSTRIIKVAAIFVLAAIVTWFFRESLFYLLLEPAGDKFQDRRLFVTSVGEQFVSDMKLALWAAFVLTIPVILYQVWAFVAPGLYSHEKKLVLPLVASSTVLFFMGVAFCYFFVFGQVFSFIQSFAPKSITATPDIEAYLSFVLTMFLAFGTAFEDD